MYNTNVACVFKCSNNSLLQPHFGFALVPVFLSGIFICLRTLIGKAGGYHKELAVKTKFLPMNNKVNFGKENIN